jgi:hypothetical protein
MCDMHVMSHISGITVFASIKRTINSILKTPNPEIHWQASLRSQNLHKAHPVSKMRPRRHRGQTLSDVMPSLVATEMQAWN